MHHHLNFIKKERKKKKKEQGRFLTSLPKSQRSGCEEGPRNVLSEARPSGDLLEKSGEMV